MPTTSVDSTRASGGGCAVRGCAGAGRGPPPRFRGARAAVAQASGLLVLLVIVTLLARRLSPTELGAYGLVASLSGYLLVLRNSVASSAVRAMAGALDRAERERMFSAAAALYAVVGLATGVLIAVRRWRSAADPGRRARRATRGRRCGPRRSSPRSGSRVRVPRRAARGAPVRPGGLTEIVAVALYLALMLALILGGADLAWVIALSGAIPLFSGLLRRGGAALGCRSASSGRRDARAHDADRADRRLAARRRALEPRHVRVQPGDPRRLPLAGRGGPFEGPVRAHNLLYALGGALAVPVVPTASRYVAAGDERRLREFVLRGTRYTLALFVPLCVTLMVLAEPILDVWLGDRYGEGASALAILVSYWLLYGALVVTPGLPGGRGPRAAAGLVMAGAAG